MTKHYRIKICLVEIDENNQMWDETGVLYSDYIFEESDYSKEIDSIMVNLKDRANYLLERGSEVLNIKGVETA